MTMTTLEKLEQAAKDNAVSLVLLPNIRKAMEERKEMLAVLKALLASKAEHCCPACQDLMERGPAVQQARNIIAKAKS
jgi:hypothetical protein